METGKEARFSISNYEYVPNDTARLLLQFIHVGFSRWYNSLQLISIPIRNVSHLTELDFTLIFFPL